MCLVPRSPRLGDKDETQEVENDVLEIESEQKNKVVTLRHLLSASQFAFRGDSVRP